jgi:DNA mismatch repair ATPase MutS
MINRELEITGKLAENEESFGRLYQVYANKFPDYRQFWQDLVSEETKHANWIRQLQSEAEKGLLLIKPYRFHIAAVQNQMKHVEDELNKAAGPEYSLTNALSAAFNFETSLLESKYFEIFDSSSLEMQKIFAELTEDTKRHAIKVRDAWQKNKDKTAK